MESKFEPSKILWEFNLSAGVSEDEVDSVGDFEWTIGLNYNTYAVDSNSDERTLGKGQDAVLKICKSLQETGRLPDWCKPEYINIYSVDCHQTGAYEDEEEDEEDESEGE